MIETRPVVPLIGRQRQLQSARSWIMDLVSGRGRVALIEGEPGIGKSSLARAVAAEAGRTGCLVLWASCDELSRAFPLLPLLDALSAQAPGTAGGTAEIVDMLRASATKADRAEIIPAAVERLLTLVHETCAASPVLLVIDDLQWADATTVVAVGRLTRSIRQLPLLVLGASRPVPRRDDLLALRRIVEPHALVQLRSLSPEEAVGLVGQAVSGAPGPRLRQLIRGAAGNPLYLTELVDSLRRAGALRIHDGLVEALGGEPPHSLAAAIADRLAFLSSPVRELLRTAALLGMEFSVSDLAVLSGQRVGDLLSTLDEAILAGVVLEHRIDLAFRHPMIRAALYDGIPAAVRGAWHRDAARALAAGGAPVERVARQLLPAVESAEVDSLADDWMVDWLARVGHQLIGQAPQVAIPLLRYAIGGVPAGVGPHELLTSRLADALYRVGDSAGAAQAALTALIHARQPELVVDLHLTLAMSRMDERPTVEALDDLRRVLDLSGIEPRDRARLRVMIARVHRSLGQVDLAGEMATAALEEATAAGDRWATGWALSLLTIVHGMRGETVAALPLFERALAVAEGDPALADLRLQLQINQAVALGDLNRHDEAIEVARRVRELAEDARNAVRLAQAQEVLGEMLFLVGQWDEALAEFVLDSDRTSVRVECHAHGTAAVIEFHRGNPTAHRRLREAERAAARLGDPFLNWLVLARSLEREHADEPEQALKVLLDGLPDSAEEAGQTVELFADAVRLAMSVRDRDTASRLLVRAEAAARDTTVPHGQAVALHCRGLVERDADTLVRAAKEYAAAGRPLPEAQALEAAAVALAEAGDAAGAREHFTEAFDRYTALGARWDLARTQATFRGYGIRRGPHTRHRRADQGWNSLTPTEVKVVELVARGMSNPGIAAQLFLSPRTVQTHVSHVLAKLNLRSRTDIAREASRRDLAGQVGDADGSTGPAVGLPVHPEGKGLLR